MAMEFDGEFELADVTAEEAWAFLSDPVAIQEALPGCKFLAHVPDEDFNFDEYEPPEDVATLPEADPETVVARAFEEGETYAALMQVGAGSVKPQFETRVTIDEREYPYMEASGGGDASSSSFEVVSWMEIAETETGALVSWGAEADVSGRVAQLGNRVIDPVADKVVTDFFGNVEARLRDVEEHDVGITSRIRSLI